MHAVLQQQLLCQVLVQVMGSVGKGCKDEHLAVAGVDGVVHLLPHQGLEVLQFGIILRADALHRGQKPVDALHVGLQVTLPRQQIHVGKVDLDLLAYLEGFITRHRHIVIVCLQVAQHFHTVFQRALTRRLEGCDLLQNGLVVVMQQL